MLILPCCCCWPPPCRRDSAPARCTSSAPTSFTASSAASPRIFTRPISAGRRGGKAAKRSSRAAGATPRPTWPMTPARKRCPPEMQYDDTAQAQALAYLSRRQGDGCGRTLPRGIKNHHRRGRCLAGSFLWFSVLLRQLPRYLRGAWAAGCRLKGDLGSEAVLIHVGLFQ